MNYNEFEARPGIYKATCIVNNKKLVYVGLSNNVRRRINQHVNLWYQDDAYAKYFYSAIKMVGIENVRFEIIEYCSTDELGIKEMYWIEHYKSYDRNYGFNQSRGGEGAPSRSYKGLENNLLSSSNTKITNYFKNEERYQHTIEPGQVAKENIRRFSYDVYYVYYIDNDDRRKYYTDQNVSKYTLVNRKATIFKFDSINTGIDYIDQNTSHSKKQLQIEVGKEYYWGKIFIYTLVPILIIWLTIYIVVGILTNFVSALIVFPLPFIIILGLIFPGKKK